jgi:hypothetical protein
MKTIPLAFAAALMATTAMAPTAMAQGTTGTTTGTGTTMGTTGSTMGNMANGVVNAPGAAAGAAGRATDRTLGTNMTGTNAGGSNAGANAAGGNNNQAVATTNANAPQPARGANSFSRGEARGRISSEGFQNVSNLRKDNMGVWRGTATKNGQQVHVWLDYKGNIGQQ